MSFEPCPPKWQSIMTHTNGVPWYEAKIPMRIHRCKIQTTGMVGFEFVHRCACGAIKMARYPGWAEKNSRRKEKKR